MTNSNDVKTIANDEKFLRQISSNVDIKNDVSLSDDIKVLEEYCKNNDVLAMAAVQLGIPKRLLYIKNTNLDVVERSQHNLETEEDKVYNEARVLINPVIKKQIGLTDYWEACASCLDNFGRVLRPYIVELEYFDISGNHFSEVFEGFEATVLSHELDHLDGILHMDIAEELFIMPVEKRQVWRNSHGYNIYAKTGDYEVLKKQLKKSM